MPPRPPHPESHPATDPQNDRRLWIGDRAAAIAAGQHGVVTRGQLLAAGCSRRTIDRHLASKRLRALHRGVYTVGPIVQPAAPEMAAILACGPHALVSHASAAWLWQFLVGVDRPLEVRVIIVGGHRNRPGIEIHRIATVRADERTVLNGIPITTPARTLYDLSSQVGARVLDRAVAEAVALRRVTVDEVVAMADRHRGRIGAGRLHAVLQGGRRPDRTRSPAEEDVRTLIRKGELPAPLVNHRIVGEEVDFYWSDHRLAVEIDGATYHSSPRAFARDRRRDAKLFDAGIRVMRVTWEEIKQSPEKLLVRIATALATPA